MLFSLARFVSSCFFWLIILRFNFLLIKLIEESVRRPAGQSSKNHFLMILHLHSLNLITLHFTTVASLTIAPRHRHQCNKIPFICFSFSIRLIYGRLVAVNRKLDELFMSSTCSTAFIWSLRWAVWCVRDDSGGDGVQRESSPRKCVSKIENILEFIVCCGIHGRYIFSCLSVRLRWRLHPIR